MDHLIYGTGRKRDPEIEGYLEENMKGHLDVMMLLSFRMQDPGKTDCVTNVALGVRTSKLHKHVSRREKL